MRRSKFTKPDILQQGDRFVSTPEAARILATTVNTLNFWRAARKGPRFYRHGRSVRYLLSDLSAWGKATCVEPSA
jgi:predicted DNA-binding transcriptional regulator AlpA